MRKIILSSIFFAVLSGCDGSDKSDLIGVDNQLEGEVSKTAVYLPGGSGIDFGRPAQKDLIREVGDSKYKVFAYEFDEPFNTLDNEVASILEKDGYIRVLQSFSGDSMVVTYTMDKNNPVVFGYNNEVKEGFSKKTVLHISWSLKGLAE